MRLLAVALAIFLLNLPFGYWRASVPKFSWRWIVAIHLPVPVVILLRVYSGLGWGVATFPVLIAAYVSGQWSGGKMRNAPEAVTTGRGDVRFDRKDDLQAG